MFTVYVYVLDTFADWEIGYITSELNSGRFFKKNAKDVSVKTVSCSREKVVSMGGLTVLCDLLVDDIFLSKESVLILPGANTWSDLRHKAVLEKAKKLLSLDALVCGICGATVALADFNLLDNFYHTSNGQGFLEMFSPNYRGANYYVNEPCVKDKNLITASPTASLLWAKCIIEHLEVFDKNTLDSWYMYFSTGEAKYFYDLMNSLPNKSTLD